MNISFRQRNKTGRLRDRKFSSFALLLILGLICTIPAFSQQKTHRPQSLVIAKVSGEINLTNGPVPVPLLSDKEDRNYLKNRLKVLRPNKRIYLVVKDLYISSQPNAEYHIYIDLPANTNPGKDSEYYAGSVTFYDAQERTGDTPTVRDDRFFSFDITDLVRNLAARKKLLSHTTVTIFPSNVPLAGSHPVIGSLRLIEQ